MGDNELVIVPKAFARPDEFASAVAHVEPMLSPEVVRLRHSLEEDWSGEPAVFFLVTLSEAAASRLDQLGRLGHHISTTIERQIEPSEHWGVYPFFRYRSESEQAVLKENAWA